MFKLIQICLIQWLYSVAVFWTEDIFWDKFGPKNHSCWLEMKFGIRLIGTLWILFFSFEVQTPFLDKFGPKINCLVKIKLCAKTNSNILNSMALFICPALDRKNTLKIPSDKITFSFVSSNSNSANSFTFNLRFIYELKPKVLLYKIMCGIFHFRFCFIFIKVYSFAQQNALALWV